MAARENGGQDCSGPVNKETTTDLGPEVTKTVPVNSNTKRDGTKSNVTGSPQNQEQQDDSIASVTVKGEEILQHNVGKKAHANADFSQTGEMSADQNKVEHINTQKEVLKSTGKQEDETEPKKGSETPLESQTDMNPDDSNENSMGYLVVSDSNFGSISPEKVAPKVEGKERSEKRDTEGKTCTSNATEGEGHSPEIKIEHKHLNQSECSNDVAEDSAVNEEPNEVDPHPNEQTFFSSQEQENENTKKPTKHVKVNSVDTTDSKQLLNSDHGMPAAGQLVPPPSSDSLQKSVEEQDVDEEVVVLGVERPLSKQLSEVKVTSEPKQPLTASATEDDSRFENDDLSNDRNDYKESTNNNENIPLESKEESFVVLDNSISEAQSLENPGNGEVLYCRELFTDKDPPNDTSLPSITKSGSQSFSLLSIPSGSYNKDMHLDTNHQQAQPLHIEERKAEDTKGSQMETKQPGNIYDDSLEKERNILPTDSNAIQKGVGITVGEGYNTDGNDEEGAEDESLELVLDSGLNSLLDTGSINKAESGHIEKEEHSSSKDVDEQDMQIGNMDDEQNGTSSGLNLDSLDFDQGSLGNIDESIEIINGSTSQPETNTTEYDKEKKKEIQNSSGNTESFTSTGLPSTSGRRSDSFSIISLPANDTDHEPEFEQTQPLITSSDDQEKDQRYDKTGEADETRSDIEGEQSPFDNGKSSSGNSNSECKTEHQGSSILQTDTGFNETETSLEDDKEISDDEKHKDQRPLTGEEDQAAPDVNGEPSSMQSFEVVGNVVSSTEISSQHQNETVDVPESPRTSAEQNLQISKFFDTMSNKRDGDEEPENTGRSSVEEVRNLGQTEDERNKTQTDQPGNSLDSDDDAEEENDNEDPQGFVDDSGAGKRDSVASDSSGRAEDELPKRDPNKCFRQKGNDKVNTPEGDNRQSGQSMMDLVQGNVKDDVNTNLETDLNGAATDGTQDDFTGNENEGNSSNYLHTKQLELQNSVKMDISETNTTPAINQDRHKEEMEDTIAKDCVDSKGKENREQESDRVDYILPDDEDHNRAHYVIHEDTEAKSVDVSINSPEWSLFSNSELISQTVDDPNADSVEKEIHAEESKKDAKKDGEEISEKTGRDVDERIKTQTEQPNGKSDSDEEAAEEGDNTGSEDKKDFVDDSDEDRRDSLASDSSEKAEGELPERDPNKCQKGNDKVKTPEADDDQSSQRAINMGQENLKDDASIDLEVDRKREKELLGAPANTGSSTGSSLPTSSGCENDPEFEKAQPLGRDQQGKEDQRLDGTGAEKTEYDMEGEPSSFGLLGSEISNAQSGIESEDAQGLHRNAVFQEEKHMTHKLNETIDAKNYGKDSNMDDTHDNTSDSEIDEGNKKQSETPDDILDSNERIGNDVNKDETVDTGKSRNGLFDEFEKVDPEQHEIKNITRTGNLDTDTVSTPTGSIDEDKKSNFIATNNFGKRERESDNLEDKTKAQVSKDWSVISNSETSVGPNTDSTKLEASKTSMELTESFRNTEDLAGENQQERLLGRHDDGADKSATRTAESAKHKGLDILSKLDQDDEDNEESDTSDLKTLHIDEENAKDDDKCSINVKVNVGEDDKVKSREDMEWNETDPDEILSPLPRTENFGKSLDDHKITEDHETSIENQVDTKNLHPKDKVQQNEPQTSDNYEIPPVLQIYIQRMWTGVMKEGRSSDIVPVRLENEIDFGKWTLLFSNESTLAPLKVELDQEETSVMRGQGSEVFLTVKNLGTTKFQDMDQVGQWWLRVMKTIRKHLNTFKVYTCRFMYIGREILSTVMEHFIIQEEQAICVKDDISSNEFSLLGPSEAVNTIICHLWKLYEGCEVKKDGNQLSIMHCSTTVENAQLMQMFHLPDIFKHQKDVDLMIEKNELYIIGANKPDEDMKKTLQTDDWMYEYLQRDVLMYEPLLKMLRSGDNLQYVEKQIKSAGKVFHIALKQQCLVLFAERDETAKKLMGTLTSCFKEKTHKLLIKPDPQEGLQKIFQKYGYLVQTNITQNQFHWSVKIYAREDKFEEIGEEIDNFSEELVQQIQQQSKELEVDKHVYQFLRQQRKEVFEKEEVTVTVDEREDRMVLKFTGTSVTIKDVCHMVSEAREDLETQACDIEAHAKSRDEEFINCLEKKYKCCIEIKTETDEGVTDTEDKHIVDIEEDKMPSTYDEPQQSWKYRNTTVYITQGDIHQANVDVVVNPDSQHQLGLVVPDTDTEAGRKSSSMHCRLGIPEYQGRGKDKSDLFHAFGKLFQCLNQKKEIHSIGIPVYHICNWDYKKFVKRMLASVQGLVHRLVLFVPNEDVEKGVAEIISEASDNQPIVEPIAINVKLGDITKEEVDVIVNTTASDLELDKGQGVSVAILKAAGDKIQKQCKSRNRFGNSLPPGEIIVTDGFDLKCKEVYHGTLQEWSSSCQYKQMHAETGLKTFMQNCLKETLKSQRESISFPVLGTGVLAYPTELVANIMLDEIKTFSDQHPEKCLKVVNIVVYTKEKAVFEIFHHELRSHGIPLNESPVDPGPVGLRIGDAALQITSEDVRTAVDYQGLVLMWTFEDVNNPLSGCAEIIRAAGQEVLFKWNKLKKDIHKHKVFTATGGNLPQTTIFNVYTDKEKLQESFTTAMTVTEAYGVSSVVFCLGKKDALSGDLDKYASSLYQALKLHKNSMGPQPVRIKICTDSQDSCADLQHKLVCLSTGEMSTEISRKGPIESKGMKKDLVVKVHYMITGKKQDINRVIIALTDGDIAEDLQYTDEIDNAMDTKSSVKMEMNDETSFVKKDNFEDMVSEETDVAPQALSDNKQDTFKGPLVRPKEFRSFRPKEITSFRPKEITSTSSVVQESCSSPVSQYPHLHATDDVKCCLVAESNQFINDELKCKLLETLKKHIPVAVICPYNDKSDEALVVYDRPADASSVLQDQKTKSEMQTLKIQLKQMPPQVIYNLKAGLDITKLLLSGNRTLRPEIVENSLRESSGVKIQKEPGKWYLEGTLHQLKEANQYLRGLIVDMETSGIKNEKTSKSDDDVEEVFIDHVTVAVYTAFLYFSCKDDDKKALSKLHYDESKQQVVIKGTYDDVQRNKKFLKRIMKCECDSINVSGKKLTLSVVKEKLVELRKNGEVYIHITEDKDNNFVEDISFLGLDVDAVKKVKQQAFEKLSLTTNRRNRFAKSDGAQLKDSYSLPKSTTTESDDKLRDTKTTRNTANNSFSETPRNSVHFKAADIFHVYVYQGDILYLNVDCIVNAANSELDHGGGVAKAIADAAGHQFYRESRDYVKQHGKIKVGHSCHTSAGRLKYKHVIHTVGPRWDDYKKSIRLDRCREELRLAVESAVLEANNCGMTSVAIPAISSGLYGVPHNVCVTQYALGVIGACSQLERRQRVSLQEIHFVDKSYTLINMMKNTFQELLSMEDEAEYPYFPGSQDAHPPSSKYEEIPSPYWVDNIPHGRLDRPSSPPLKDTPMFDGKAGSSPSGIYNFPNGRCGRPVSPSPQHITRFDDGPGNVRDQDSPETTKKTNEPSSNTAAQQDNRSDVYPYSGTDIEHEVFKYIYSLSESVEIQVYNADILDTNVDGLVFGEDKDLQTKSRIGRAIRNIDKKSFDEKVEQYKTRKLKIGNVFGLQLEYVRQGVIFLLVIPSWDAPGTTHGDCMNGLKKGVINVLNKAAENGLRSIAMPVLGTGNTGAPVEVAAKSIIEKIQEYFLTTNKSCPLKQVHLVCKNEGVVTTIKTIMDGKMLKKREMHDILLAIGNQRPKPDASKPQSVKGGSMFATSTHEKEQLTCDICKNNITRHKIKVLSKCKHVFHKTCIDNQFEHTPVCPTCGCVYGAIYGNQPGNGKMNIKRWNPPGLPDYANAGYFEITYSFKDGIQTEGHPHPGSRYEGTSRTAYLPDTKRGRPILEMLKIAFERRLTFTIGQSRTTGKNNVIIWNDIHHKTSMSGGPQSYGYPDSGYFDRVIKELKAKGITPEDVKK